VVDVRHIEMSVQGQRNLVDYAILTFWSPFVSLVEK